jgi:hypothetical protein
MITDKLEMSRKYLAIVLLIMTGISCRHSETGTQNPENASRSPEIKTQNPELCSVQRLTELQPCDILVKPNLNFIPGTSPVPGGSLFGHTVIVIRGSKDTNEVALLSKAIIFESQADDVPPEYQLRQIAAYIPGTDSRYANTSFGPDRFGNLYRLRMELTDAQRQAIISYIMDKDDDLSSYRAMKRYKRMHETSNDSLSYERKPEYWYCSLLIWQAFYDVLGIDIDANKGVYVYPNDLINSPYFNDEPGKHEKKVRF